MVRKIKSAKNDGFMYLVLTWGEKGFLFKTQSKNLLDHLCQLKRARKVTKLTQAQKDSAANLEESLKALGLDEKQEEPTLSPAQYFIDDKPQI